MHLLKLLDIVVAVIIVGVVIVAVVGVEVKLKFIIQLDLCLAEQNQTTNEIWPCFAKGGELKIQERYVCVCVGLMINTANGCLCVCACECVN